MRKIKFRAYHKKQKKMYYNVEKTYDYGCNGDNDVLAESFAEILEDNNYDIMQYTGLKDKNGNEIYEGDILSLSIHSKKYGVIKWNDNLGGFYIYKVSSYTLKYADRYEVIGNIYDNSELLEKE